MQQQHQHVGCLCSNLANKYTGLISIVWICLGWNECEWCQKTHHCYLQHRVLLLLLLLFQIYLWYETHLNIIVYYFKQQQNDFERNKKNDTHQMMRCVFNAIHTNKIAQIQIPNAWWQSKPPPNKKKWNDEHNSMEFE